MRLLNGDSKERHVTGSKSRLVEISLRKRAEDPHGDGGENEGAGERLEEDSILNLA